MRMKVSVAAAGFALALGACGSSEEAAPEGAETAVVDEMAAISDADLRGYKTSCEISAVGNGATADQAKGLCECTVTALAEGKTAAEFDALSEAEASAALELCVQQTGIGG